MHKAVRWTLLLSLIAISFAVAWDFTPRSTGRNKAKDDVTASNLTAKSHSAFQTKGINGLLAANNVAPIPAPSIVPDPPDGEEEDPDLPVGMAGRVDKEAYLRARGDFIDLLRGRNGDAPADAREKAIRAMDRQEAQLAKQRSSAGFAPNVNTTNWSFLGPAPIPNGQTSIVSPPVSGRTISIAVHPTNPDTVYVGSAQGGLYKSTNGGGSWTALFDFQLESLA